MQHQEPSDTRAHPYTVRVGDAAFIGRIPENYHWGLGPFLFEPFARELVSRVELYEPARILEVACGTGIVTRRLRAALPAAELVATDLNEPMLTLAKRTLGPRAPVTWRSADMTDLPFDAGAFDGYVGAFGLMFVPDKRAAAREARRVLRPGGRAFISTWRPLERNPVWRCAHDVVASFFPTDPPQFYRTPTGFGEPRQIAELLFEAGFDGVHSEIVEITSVAPSARELAVGFIEGFPVVDLIKARRPALLPVVVDALAERLSARFGNPPTAPIAALITSATVPSL